VADPAGEFSAYVAARQRALVRMAFRLTGDHHAAEDLVQSALARTYLAWGGIRDKSLLDAYVRRAMVNEHTTWWRRPWRRRERSTAVLPEHGAVDQQGFASRDGVLELIATLPPRQRAAVVLRYYEDLSQVETALVLGCSVGTVKSQVSRALATLRVRLAEHGIASTTTYLTADDGVG
jgi:RNA polymerase sigma-70 factor (sigma-E family)